MTLIGGQLCSYSYNFVGMPIKGYTVKGSVLQTSYPRPPTRVIIGYAGCRAQVTTKLDGDLQQSPSMGRQVSNDSPRESGWDWRHPRHPQELNMSQGSYGRTRAGTYRQDESMIVSSEVMSYVSLKDTARSMQASNPTSSARSQGYQRHTAFASRTLRSLKR